MKLQQLLVSSFLSLAGAAQAQENTNQDILTKLNLISVETGFKIEKALAQHGVNLCKYEFTGYRIRPESENPGQPNREMTGNHDSDCFTKSAAKNDQSYEELMISVHGSIGAILTQAFQETEHLIGTETCNFISVNNIKSPIQGTVGGTLSQSYGVIACGIEGWAPSRFQSGSPDTKL